MKKRISLLVALLLCLSLASCNSAQVPGSGSDSGSGPGTESSAPEGSTATDDDVIKVGFSIPTQREIRWVTCVEKLQARIDEIPNMELIVQSADNDSQKQYSQIENMITQGIDVLLVCPEDSASIGPVLDEAHEKGIYIIGYTRTGEQCWMDAYMTFDFETIGRYQAECAVEHSPTGNYVLCMCDENMISIYGPMRQGVFSVLQPYIDSGDINIVLEHAIPNVDPSTAMADVENALTMTGNDVQAIIAVNDNVASGCISALTSAGLEGQVYVSGMDGELTALKRIMDGSQTMTTLIDLDQEVDIALEMINKFVSGEEDSIPFNSEYDNGKMQVPLQLYPPVLVTKDNIQETVINKGIYTLEEINGAS